MDFVLPLLPRLTAECSCTSSKWCVGQHWRCMACWCCFARRCNGPAAGSLLSSCQRGMRRGIRSWAVLRHRRNECNDGGHRCCRCCRCRCCCFLQWRHSNNKQSQTNKVKQSQTNGRMNKHTNNQQQQQHPTRSNKQTNTSNTDSNVVIHMASSNSSG